MVWAGICHDGRLPSSSHECPIDDRSGNNAGQEELGCDSGSENLDKHEPRDILHCHVERRDQSFAGICHDGRSQLKIVQGTLNVVKYGDDILGHIVLSCLQQRYTR
jgi:hypothetical protein